MVEEFKMGLKWLHAANKYYQLDKKINKGFERNSSGLRISTLVVVQSEELRLEELVAGTKGSANFCF